METFTFDALLGHCALFLGMRIYPPKNTSPLGYTWVPLPCQGSLRGVLEPAIDQHIIQGGALSLVASCYGDWEKFQHLNPLTPKI